MATVSSTQGSTPQKPGSSAVFGASKILSGTVGGGKVEYLVKGKATKAIQSKISGYYQFTLNDDISELDSVICGGRMGILIDASPESHQSVFESLKASILKRIPGVLITVAKSNDQNSLHLERFWATPENSTQLLRLLPPEILLEVNSILKQNIPDVYKCIELEQPNKFVFLESIIPLPKLVIAGAGHIGKVLCHLGKLIGFETIVWDDRPDFANTSNLPDADTVLSGELGKSLKDVKAGRDTFIVIVTRGHKQDSDVLKHFIRSNAAYIGMIGSKKKVAQIKELFLNQGWATPSEWENIHAPIGLDIKSKTVEEIAISIAAELIQERYKLFHTNG